MEEVKKKRVRKKTCEIDSLEKLKSDTRTNPKESSKDEYSSETKTKSIKVSVKSDKTDKADKANKTDKADKADKASVKIIKPKTSKKESQEDQNQNQSQISFGKFNITVKKKETMTAEELRAYYDNKFKIEDSEKTAKLMVQEDDNNVIFEPIMEDDVYVPKKDLKQTVEKTRTRADRTNVHRVLSKFIEGIKEEWPEKTDIFCWWCCHSFDTIPIPCPIEYDEIRDRYKVNGVFCSWSCAAAYSVKEHTSLALIYQLKNELCGYSENIVVAPPKHCLKAFGGYMTIKDYRALDKTKTLLISTEGLSYINQEIVEIKHN